MRRRTKMIIFGGTVIAILVTLMLFSVMSIRLGSMSPYPPDNYPPDKPITPNVSLAAIDRILKDLELGTIAFNTPTTIPLGDSVVIHLLLSTKESIETLQSMIDSVGEKTGAHIRVSNEMEARLTGKGFKIEAITPEAQAVSGTEVTEWKWEIKPTEGGKQRLHLTLSALLYLEGHRTPRAIRSFERTIEIHVSWPNKVSDFVANNWQWLWTTLLVPVGGWLIRRSWKRGESNGKPDNT